MPEDPSRKNMLIFVHGMGEHTRESAENEIRSVLSEALGRPIDDDVDVRAIAYNHVFNSWRRRAEEDWSAAVGALAGRTHFTRLRSWLEGLTDINDEHFNRTHWLDVALYLSNLGVRVQLEVARQLTALLREFNAGGNLHSRRLVVMGHSLGTAVLHDTLYLMWTGGFEHDRTINLSGLALKFDALFQLANTSRLLKTMVDPTSTRTSVRPAGSGMVERMYNVNHQYDPIALIKAFRIEDLAHWLPGEDYPEDLYLHLELKGIHDLNVHSLSHYLADPRLHCYLFNELVPGSSFGDCYERRRQHDEGVAGEEVENLKRAIEAVRFERIESPADIVGAVKQLSEAQAGIEASWEKMRQAVEELGDGRRD